MVAVEAPVAGERSDGLRALAIFGAVGLVFFALYLGSVVLFADLGALSDPDGRFGLVRIARFNGALGLVLAYMCASLWLGRRWVRHDLHELRRLVEASETEWFEWERRAPAKGRLVRAALLGAACGIAVDVIGGRASYVAPDLWRGHVVWVRLLNPAVFSLMGMLVAFSGFRARIYQELGRRASVTLGDVSALLPFARAGLRIALLWFLGTSLASLLLVDTDSPVLVISILLATTGIGIVSILAPSRGVHERLREAKRQELGWLRAEIARASNSLRRGDTEGAAQLPALLAWESRVAAAAEWPFDTSTWFRFALLLLVPLGSWLGGAFAERALDALLG